MEIAEDVRTTVQDIERDIRDKQYDADQLTKTHGIKLGELTALIQTMNFREKHLGGWFGGDKEKVAAHNTLNTEVTNLGTQIKSLCEEIEARENGLIIELSSRLRLSNPDFAQLVLPRDTASNMLSVTNRMLTVIDDALSEVDDAQGMEVLDMTQSNPGFSIMSYAENQEAKRALETVETMGEAFQAAVDTYNDFRRDYRVPEVNVEIDDTLDLVFDLAFDGFDFMSLFVLSDLYDAEDRLRTARRSVVEFHGKVSGHLEKATTLVDAYIHRARRACAE